VILGQIEDGDLLLRALSPDSDNLGNYLTWMSSPARNPFIVSAREDYSRDELIRYLHDVNQSSDAVQFAIFNRDDGEASHIGNIKFHDLSVSSKTCFVGFLIGEEAWRGKGLANRAFELGARLILKEFDIRTFKLGVDSANSSAIRAYEKMGFRVVGTNGSANFMMELDSGP
jgi:ribosomal-protein-alanine N-acetyltransferase